MLFSVDLSALELEKRICLWYIKDTLRGNTRIHCRCLLITTSAIAIAISISIELPLMLQKFDSRGSSWLIQAVFSERNAIFSDELILHNGDVVLTKFFSLLLG